MSFQTTNPATGERLANYDYLSSADIDRGLNEATTAARAARRSTVKSRAESLSAVARALRAQQKQLGRSMTLEMGKAIRDSFAEVEKCAVACDFFSQHLEEFLAPQTISANYPHAQIVKDPLGPVLAIMPWNFPLWQVIRFAAPALGIGNPILLKHADLTAGTAEKINAIFNAAQPGSMFNFRIAHEQAETVIADARVRGVTLTGSTRAGRQVAKIAGQALKKTVLELGGSDAYVVFADSDVEKAADICAQARMTNNGQSCVAAKRFVVEKSVRTRFIEAFRTALSALRFGDPLQESTRVGSLAAKRFQEQLEGQCAKLAKAGAKELFNLGDSPVPDPHGAYFAPRAYLVNSTLPEAFSEEFFGPVALVFEFSDEAEALQLANQSIYGLGGAVFSGDLEKAQRVARAMECGFVAINDMVKSDARLPFGGVKESGYGRELSLYGFNEFCNVKSIGRAEK